MMMGIAVGSPTSSEKQSLFIIIIIESLTLFLREKINKYKNIEGLEKSSEEAAAWREFKFKGKEGEYSYLW
jgi:uncharacterized membrane protein